MTQASSPKCQFANTTGSEGQCGAPNPQLTSVAADKSVGPGRGGGHCQGYQEGHVKPAYFLSLSAGGSHRDRPSGRPLGLDNALLGLRIEGSKQGKPRRAIGAVLCQGHSPATLPSIITMVTTALATGQFLWDVPRYRWQAVHCPLCSMVKGLVRRAHPVPGQGFSLLHLPRTGFLSQKSVHSVTQRGAQLPSSPMAGRTPVQANAYRLHTH